MNWEDIKLALNYLIIGASIGYFWHPIWAILKKIWHEAKVAQNEWRKSNNKNS